MIVEGGKYLVSGGGEEKRIKRRKYLVSGEGEEKGGNIWLVEEKKNGGECLDKERLLSVDEMKN